MTLSSVIWSADIYIARDVVKHSSACASRSESLGSLCRCTIPFALSSALSAHFVLVEHYNSHVCMSAGQRQRNGCMRVQRWKMCGYCSKVQANEKYGKTFLPLMTSGSGRKKNRQNAIPLNSLWKLILQRIRVTCWFSRSRRASTELYAGAFVRLGLWINCFVQYSMRCKCSAFGIDLKNRSDAAWQHACRAQVCSLCICIRRWLGLQCKWMEPICGLSALQALPNGYDWMQARVSQTTQPTFKHIDSFMHTASRQNKQTKMALHLPGHSKLCYYYLNLCSVIMIANVETTIIIITGIICTEWAWFAQRARFFPGQCFAQK